MASADTETSTEASAEHGQPWRSAGTHRFRFEPPDFLHIVWIGEVTVEHTDTVFEAMRQFGGPPLYVLQNIAQSSVPGAKVRKNMRADLLYAMTAACAYVGGSYSVNIVVTMLVRAMQILSKTQINVAFFATEAEGRAWLEAKREAAKKIDEQTSR